MKVKSLKTLVGYYNFQQTVNPPKDYWKKVLKFYTEKKKKIFIRVVSWNIFQNIQFHHLA